MSKTVTELVKGELFNIPVLKNTWTTQQMICCYVQPFKGYLFGIACVEKESKTPVYLITKNRDIQTCSKLPDSDFNKLPDTNIFEELKSEDKTSWYDDPSDRIFKNTEICRSDNSTKILNNKKLQNWMNELFIKRSETASTPNTITSFTTSIILESNSGEIGRIRNADLSHSDYTYIFTNRVYKSEREGICFRHVSDYSTEKFGTLPKDIETKLLNLAESYDVKYYIHSITRIRDVEQHNQYQARVKITFLCEPKTI